MKSSSVYYELRYIVQCKRPALMEGHPRWFVTIAAFDHDGVAIDYAKKCHKNQRIDGFDYQVIARRGRNYDLLWSSEQ